MLLFCASTQVAAEVCEAEIRQSISTANSAMPTGTQDLKTRKYYDDHIRMWSSANCSEVQGYIKSAIETGKVRVEEAVRRVEHAKRDHMANSKIILTEQTSVDHFKFSLCAMRATEARCSSSTASTPSSGSNSTNRPSPANPASTNSQEASRQNTAMREAEARAQNNQTKVDRARKGKPKRHVPGAEAHHCLKPQKGGGVVNSCPFAIEYTYCVYRPHKDSWSGSFDCEKNQWGSWQIGAGPNNRSIMHTGGEWVYWFACKYGSDYSHPDGISPADFEFQIGRGLLGRCAEWGSRGSTASGGSNQASPLSATPQRCYADANRKCIGPRGCIKPPGGCFQ